VASAPRDCFFAGANLDAGVNPDTHDPKAGERAYYANLGAAGLAHAAGKPFSDPRCGCYLADLGALLLLLEPAPRRILDLGCGTGWTSRFLARAGYQVTGIDIATEAIVVARELAAAEGVTGVEFSVGDYESATAAGEFDYVLFYDALHHAEDEVAAVRAAWRALKPGGAMFCFEPGSGHSRSRSSRRAVEEFGVHEKDMPPGKIAALGRQAGFRRWTHLPAPHEVGRSIYRRDYHEAARRGRLWLEKAWGCYRLFTRVLGSRRKGGLTILWKE
jgi:SAM-dependent methyltransferase